MPVCPKCKVVLGMGGYGVVCPKCKKQFSPMALHKLPDYDFFTIMPQMQAFIEIMDMGLVGNGIYYLHFANDGIVLELCGKLDD